MSGPQNFHHEPDDLGRTNVYSMYPSAAMVIVVDVDIETGIVAMRHIHAVGDCGTVINSNFVHGQIRGAIAQGIGGALWEQSPCRSRYWQSRGKLVQALPPAARNRHATQSWWQTRNHPRRSPCSA